MQLANDQVVACAQKWLHLNHLKSAEKTYCFLADKYSFWNRIDCFKEGKLLTKEDISLKLWCEIKKLI